MPLGRGTSKDLALNDLSVKKQGAARRLAFPGRGATRDGDLDSDAGKFALANSPEAAYISGPAYE
jgi:hypothetical protein